MTPTSKKSRRSIEAGENKRSHKRRDAAHADSSALCAYTGCQRRLTGHRGKKYCCRDHQQKARQLRDRTVFPEQPCAYPLCGVMFQPNRKGQKYHRRECRKAHWFESHFAEIPTAQFKPGDTVRDLNGRTRKVVSVEWSVAYFLDGEPGNLYQPDEVHKWTEANSER